MFDFFFEEFSIDSALALTVTAPLFLPLFRSPARSLGLSPFSRLCRVLRLTVVGSLPLLLPCFVLRGLQSLSQRSASLKRPSEWSCLVLPGRAAHFVPRINLTSVLLHVHQIYLHPQQCLKSCCEYNPHPGVKCSIGSSDFPFVRSRAASTSASLGPSAPVNISTPVAPVACLHVLRLQALWRRTACSSVDLANLAKYRMSESLTDAEGRTD